MSALAPRIPSFQRVNCVWKGALQTIVVLSIVNPELINLTKTGLAAVRVSRLFE